MKRLLRFLHHPSRAICKCVKYSNDVVSDEVPHNTRLNQRAQRYTNAGFTIVELIIAMAVTSIMITLAGYGLTTMLRANQQSGSEISRRTNLNRALDFMADEVRMARIILPTQSSEFPTTVNSCGTTSGAMTLQMPDSSRIVYYVHTITNSNCSGNLWARNATIRRRVLGPTGTLVSDTLLVDGITAPSAAPTGCSPSPLALYGANGFYACIDTNLNVANNSRTATLYLYGRLTNAQGVAVGTYPVTGQVTARSF